MLFRFQDGQTVRIDQSFARAGVNYPAEWLRAQTPEERQAFGLEAIEEPAPFDGRYFFAPGQPRSLADAKTSRLAELATLRFARETGGVAGFRTDRESQSLIVGAALAATLDPGYTVEWKTGAGWATLNAAQLLAAAQAVRAHVQACFSNERALGAAIEAAGDLQAVLAVDLGQGWPA
ncbi:MAG: DUF4376 domain-containing protein [Tagaea sp.]